MSKAKAEGVKVSVLRHHTFRGKDYEPGDSYVVDGDQGQTAEQYVDTLRGSGLARRADEAGQGPNVVQEVSGVDENDAKAKSAVAPLSTENFQQPADEAPAPAAKPAKAAKAAKAGGKRAAKPAAGKVAKAAGKKR